MKITCIMCGVLRAELEHAARNSPHEIEFVNVEAGLHDRPLELRAILQSEISRANRGGDADYILLAYGLCGRGTLGLRTEKIPVVIPRSHDCIAFFLGSNREYYRQFGEYPGTYYLSASWIDEKALPQLSRRQSFLPDAQSFEDYAAKYGEDNAAFIYDFFNRWKRNYKRVAFVSTGIKDEDGYRRIARDFARENGLLFEEITSDDAYLRAFIGGPWDERDFHVLRPGYISVLGEDHLITSVEPGGGRSAPDGAEHLRIERKRIELNPGREERVAERGLGVDAGGTYTDAVIYDFPSGRILSKGKALTTRADLKRGILNAIDQLDPGLFPGVRRVAVSTTLATNAIVERKTRPVGLLLMGLDPRQLRDIQFEPKRLVRGAMDITGRITEDIDPAEIRAAVQGFIGTAGIQAAAVAGFGSVVNPIHEQAVKKIIRDAFGMPVICGHELSMELDCIRRANTAVMNAQLIPLLTQFIASLEEALKERCFSDYDFRIVRGDGTLVSASYATEYPVQTTLSGPAASCIGAMHLTGERDGIIVDIGGTTTDIIPVSKGEPDAAPSGAEVGGIRTSIPTLDISTHGLGGDSYIRMNRRRSIEIGPRRVTPLSQLASEHRGIRDQLEELAALLPLPDFISEPVDFFAASGGVSGHAISGEEKRLISLLGERPLSRWHIARRMNAPDPSLIPVEHLENLGIIERAALTPTDVLIFLGRIEGPDPHCAELAFALYERLTRRKPGELAGEILKEMHDRLAFYTFTKLLEKGLPQEFRTEMERGRLLHSLFTAGAPVNGYSISFKMLHPVIGIGAPAHAYMPSVGKKLSTRLLIPEHFEVANALGAIVGRLLATAKVSIRPGDFGVYSVSSGDARMVFQDLAEATEFAYRKAGELTVRRAGEMGADVIELSVGHEDHYGSAKETDVFLERIITGRAQSAESGTAGSTLKESAAAAKASK